MSGRDDSTIKLADEDLDAPAGDSRGTGAIALERSNDSPVQVGTHFFRQRYLFAFATQAEVLHYLRTQSSNTDAMRQAEIMRAWTALQTRVARLLQTEAGLADTLQPRGIPDEYQPTLEAFAADPL